MRLIGYIEDETQARTFRDYLYVQGIGNQVEAEDDGRWGVWVYDEDHLEQAGEMLKTFRAQPDHPDYHQEAIKAAQQREEEEKKERAARKRYFSRDRIFPRFGLGVGRLTTTLIGLSVMVTLIGFIDAPGKQSQYQLLQPFFITQVDYVGSDRIRFSPTLPEIRSGQVWRLVTPAFIHFGILHLAVDMYWLWLFGGLIEARQGAKQLAWLALLIAVTSNLGQFFVGGPLFGGMSGVVFGLFGYIWIRSKFDPASGLFIDQGTVILLLIWFVVAPMISPRIAHMAHGMGLGVGVLTGFATAWLANRRLHR